MISQDKVKKINNHTIIKSILNDENYEPLFDNSLKRYTTFPIEFPEIWKFYKNHISVFWTVEEVDLKQDVNHFKMMNKDEQFFIKQVLAFFAASDGIVNENLVGRFIDDIQILEAKCYYGFQYAMETIHGEMYSKLIETYIQDEDEKDRLFNAVEHNRTIKKKAQWADKWFKSTESFATRLVAFACIEGIFFSGSFAAIYWIKKKGLMPGLTLSNQFISRDEGIHTDFACLLYQYISNKSNKVVEIVKEAVEIEQEFFRESLPVRLIGMNADLMNQYVEFVADRLLYELGYARYFKVSNPFSFMDNISLRMKANFLENTVSDYSKYNPGEEEEAKNLDFNADF